RMTRGKINLTKEGIELAPLIERGRETVQPLIEERGHDLKVVVPKRTLTALGDPMRLTRAPANVLGNAAKYTNRGGQISVCVSYKDSEIEMRIRDPGIGIHADHLPMIFNLFTQIDRSSSRTQSGLGIGLALVRRLIEMHGGSVTAHSDGPGKGS